MYKGHVVEIIGLLDNHIDHGRHIKALSIREVKSPFQLAGHLMEVALQFKRWAEGGDSNKENMVASGVSNVKSNTPSANSGGNKNDIVENLIKKLPKNQVDEAVQYLIDEGMIYNTLDDDTFKSS